MKSANRDFFTGFYLGRPGSEGQVFDGATHSKIYDFVGIVKDYDEVSGVVTIEQRNKFVIGDVVEFMRANGDNFSQEITQMHDVDGNVVEAARHAQQIIKIRTDKPTAALDIVRMRL